MFYDGLKTTILWKITLRLSESIIFKVLEGLETRVFPQTAFTLWGSHSCVIPGGVLPPPLPPGWLCFGSFLLLFTTLLHRSMHFVEMRAALGPLFIVKHNTFEHSTGPCALRAPWAPGVHKGPQMTLQMALQMTRFTPRILDHEYCTTKIVKIHKITKHHKKN